MKKVKRRLTFATMVAGAALAAALTACHETVYGPPETVYGPPKGDTSDPASEFPETVYGPPAGETYDPSSEIPEDVYGPPMGDWGTNEEDLDALEEDASDTLEEDASNTFEEDASDGSDLSSDGETVISDQSERPEEVDRVAPALYGPPEDYDEDLD